ncbi:TraB/GumN family protein [Curvibacter sp. CHRR-16]|uniref:TraB/GumN family protein n=1 Tax=Curvibacter sp. CHRR-16 TaxID=2835872 RepID=UPI001BD98425|nr:TraB/GumN family protein [Curvibacter sp. CHRR-16]MBT0568733.1 TraB/GumN family protein [Curvibacter sp. CHRR-16]
MHTNQHTVQNHFHWHLWMGALLAFFLLCTNSFAQNDKEKAIASYLQSNKLELPQRGGQLYKATLNGQSLYLFGLTHTVTVDENKSPFTREVLSAVADSNFYYSENGMIDYTGRNFTDTLRFQKLIKNSQKNYTDTFSEEEKFIFAINIAIHRPKESPSINEILHNNKTNEAIAIGEKYNPVYWLTTLYDLQCISISQSNIESKKIKKRTEVELIKILKSFNTDIHALEDKTEFIQKTNKETPFKTLAAALQESIQMQLSEQSDCLEIWESTDENELNKYLSDRFFNKKYNNYNIFSSQLLTQRNLDFAEKINNPPADKIGVGFYAVGSGHLFGEQGLIKLLQAKGYKLEKLQ